MTFPNGTPFDSIILDGNGYTLTGNRVLLDSNGITANIGTNTLNLDVAIEAQADTVITVAGGATLMIGGNNAGVLRGGSGVGLFSQASALHKRGSGLLQLNRDNTYRGETVIDEGALRIRTYDGLGATGISDDTVAQAGGTLELEGDITLREGLHLFSSGFGNGGALRAISGSSTLTGSDVNLFNNAVFAVDSGATLSISSQFFHVDTGITKIGPGQMVMAVG